MSLFNLLPVFIILVVSFFTILVSNPVHSVLLLILTFCLSAAYLFYVGAEFISLLYIIVYVGAVAVLFLFIVMMINVRLVDLSSNKQVYLLTFSFVICLICLILFKTKLFSYYHSEIDLFWYDNTWSSFFESFYVYKNFVDPLFLHTVDVSLGFVLFTFFGFSTFLAAFLLFIALVGSIILVLPFHLTTNQRTLLQSSLIQINQDFRN